MKQLKELKEIAVKVKLFSGQVVEKNPKTAKWELYPLCFVNGKAVPQKNKRPNCYTWKQIEAQAKLIYGEGESIVAERKTLRDPLQYKHGEYKKENLTPHFFIKCNGLVVRKLSSSEKMRLKKELQVEGVQNCQFEDQEKYTVIRTNARGYRIIAYLQSA